MPVLTAFNCCYFKILSIKLRSKNIGVASNVVSTPHTIRLREENAPSVSPFSVAAEVPTA